MPNSQIDPVADLKQQSLSFFTERSAQDVDELCISLWDMFMATINSGADAQQISNAAVTYHVLSRYLYQMQMLSIVC